MNDKNSGNDQMLEIFLFEMNSLVDKLDEILLDSESNKALTEEDVSEIFRIMHTVKGSSAMMDFHVISGVTHKLEDCFFLIRDNGIKQEHMEELFDVMLDATDFLKEQFAAIAEGEALASENEALIKRSDHLYALLKGEAPKEDLPVKETAPPPPPKKTDTAGTAGKEKDKYSIHIEFDSDIGMENLRALMVVEQLKQNGINVISWEPYDIENNETIPQILELGFTVTAGTAMDGEKLEKFVQDLNHVKECSVNPYTEEHEDYSSLITGERFDVKVYFEDNCGMENLRAFMLLNTLKTHCRIISYTPADIETNAESCGAILSSGFDIILETPVKQKELHNILSKAMHVKHADIKKADTSKENTAPKAAGLKAAGKAAPAPAHAKPVRQNLINVNLSKLDELMDLMGELVITESMVVNSPDLKGISNLENFGKSARQLRKLTDELQDMVMSIRMVPISGTFQKMQRIVRDMCKALGKEAVLATMGEDTDIDKTIVDAIGDPIMHLVRNAMDHAIETPEEREAKGKPVKGTVTLSAQNTGGEILITISDDGKGLDAEKLLEKAGKNGLLKKSASEYSDKEAFQLLMLPGFSTKEAVTEFSGRGVGMDVVKKNIEKIGGTVNIESKKGQGTSIFLKIPLTLAIVEGIDFKVGGSMYTLQITSINESFKATSEQVFKDTDGNEMIMLRGDVYPVIRLYELYGIKDAVTKIEDGICIWVQSGENSACLLVDYLIGEQQIVVKPLPAYLNRYNIKSYGISGCTILGDGNISLILDAGNIIEKALEAR